MREAVAKPLFIVILATLLLGATFAHTNRLVLASSATLRQTLRAAAKAQQPFADAADVAGTATAAGATTRASSDTADAVIAAATSSAQPMCTHTTRR